MNYKLVVSSVLTLGVLFLNTVRADITNGLVLYLPLNETSGQIAHDSGTNHINGTLLNFPTNDTEWVPGIVSNALNIATNFALNQAVAVTNSVLAFESNLTYSIGVWVKAAPTTANPTIISKGRSVANTEQYVLDVNGDRYRFFVRNGAGTVTQINGPLGTGPNNNWQHVVAVFSVGSGNMKLYVNGALSASGVGPTTIRTNADPFCVGTRLSSSGFGQPLNGTVDEVRVFNRALTLADVQELYSYGRPVPPIVTSAPQNESRYVGDTAIFSVSIDSTSSLPLAYQWLKNMTNTVPGGTNATLTLTNLQVGDAGSYSVQVVNSAGTSNSAAATLTVSSLPTADYTTGLAAYLAVDETTGLTASDSSGNGNNASLNGFPGDDSQWVTGRILRGLNFNSSSEVATIPDSPSVNLDNGTPFTIATWVKTSGLQPSSSGLVCKGTGGGGEQFCLDTQNGFYRFFVRALNTNTTIVTVPIVPDGTWQHVVAVLDAPNRLMNVYVNSLLVAAVVPPTNILASAHEISVGNRQSTAVSAYNLPTVGTLDDVRIYTRALNSGDVRALYLTAGTAAPVFVTQPQSANRYVGDAVTFSAAIDGTYPLTYQWFKDSVGITNATNASLVLTNLQITNSGNYSLTVNGVGTAQSSNALLHVTLFTISNTAAYYQLDETSGLTTSDSSGGPAGTLVGFPGDNSEWLPGRVSGGLNFNPPSNLGEYVTVPDSTNLNFNSVLTFSIAAWVRSTTTSQLTGAAIVCKGYGSTGGAGTEQYALDVNGGTYRFYVRNAAGAAINLQSSTPVNNRWQHLVATYDANAGFMRLYVNGQLVVENPPPTGGLLANTHALTIGARESGVATGYDLLFKGLIDDVRLYTRALSSNDVQQLYTAAPIFPPVVYTPPQSATRYAGESQTFTVFADGADPLTYQWSNTSGTISGATNASLVLSNLALGNASTYTVRVSNGAGATNSAGAILQVLANPAPDINNNLVAYYTFDEISGASAADSSGNNTSATLYNFPGDDSQWTNGRIGGALHFNANGANNNFVGTDSPLVLQNGDNFTFSFWALRDPGVAGTNPRFISPLAATHWVLWTPGQGVGLFTPAPSTEPSSNTWHHFVVVVDRVAGSYSLYVDGLKQVSNAGGYPKADPTGLLWIIGHSETVASITDSWRGLLDDLRVYNRQLNANDAAALYLQGASPQMSLSFSGNSITLSWPRAATAYHLQSAIAVASTGTVWSNVGTSPVISADGLTTSVTETFGAGAKYYRLSK